MISPSPGSAPCPAMVQDSTATTCWVATDGAIGNEKQCLALAHYLGLRAEVFRIALRWPWEQLAPYWRPGMRRALLGPFAERLNGPLPDLLIGAGRRSTLAALAVSRLSGGRTFTVQVLNPRIDPGHFDLVVCPRHDALRGANVLTTLGALHCVDDDSLNAARVRWQAVLQPLPEPRVALLIGASNSAYQVDRAYLERLAKQAESWAAGGSVLVSTSRRTPAHLRRLIEQRFAGRPGHVWTGIEGEDNPYLGYLAWADRILVSADSVNMISEACGTGKPVHCTPPGTGSTKFQRFHRSMREGGLLWPLDSEPASACASLRETQAIAEQVARHLRAHQQ